MPRCATVGTRYALVVGMTKAQQEFSQKWLEQAKDAIAQGQSLKDFCKSVHYDNRHAAYKAYLKAEKDTNQHD